MVLPLPRKATGHSSVVPFTLQSLSSHDTLPWVSFYLNQKKQQQKLIQLYNQNECFCQSLFGSSFFLSFVISGWGSCRVTQADPEFMILLPTKVLGLLWSTTFSKFPENKANQDLYNSFRLRVSFYYLGNPGRTTCLSQLPSISKLEDRW